MLQCQVSSELALKYKMLAWKSRASVVRILTSCMNKLVKTRAFLVSQTDSLRQLDIYDPVFYNTWLDFNR